MKLALSEDCNSSKVTTAISTEGTDDSPIIRHGFIPIARVVTKKMKICSSLAETTTPYARTLSRTKFYLFIYQVQS